MHFQIQHTPFTMLFQYLCMCIPLKDLSCLLLISVSLHVQYTWPWCYDYQHSRGSNRLQMCLFTLLYEWHHCIKVIFCSYRIFSLLPQMRPSSHGHFGASFQPHFSQKLAKEGRCSTVICCKNRRKQLLYRYLSIACHRRGVGV